MACEFVVLGDGGLRRSRLPVYFCFIERDILSIPHMEPLTAETEAEAIEQARALLNTHASGIAAHVLHDDARVATVRRSESAT